MQVLQCVDHVGDLDREQAGVGIICEGVAVCPAHRTGCRCAASRGGRSAVQVGQGDGLPTPCGQGLGFGDRGAGVVPALGEDVQAQPLEDADGGVVLEGDDRVDAAEAAEQVRTVLVVDDGPVRALQPADGVVGVQADDQAVPQRPCRLEQAGVPGVDAPVAMTSVRNSASC